MPTRNLLNNMRFAPARFGCQPRGGRVGGWVGGWFPFFPLLLAPISGI
jgi:hypothetical protein